jgi:hypothetical protein
MITDTTIAPQSPIVGAGPSTEAHASPADERAEIAGQMAKIKSAIETMLQEKVPVPLLKPGQLHRRVEDCLKKTGLNSKEIPSRSTFDRFRRGFGRRYGLR